MGDELNSSVSPRYTIETGPEMEISRKGRIAGVGRRAAGEIMSVREKPLVLFDGKCGYCRKSVEGWRAGTGERVEYAPFQEVAEQFPEIPRAEFEQAVQLLDVDGRRYRGAEAVFRVMALVPGKGKWLWLYDHLPGFAPVARVVYGWVAKNRNVVSTLSWWLRGNHVGPSTFFLSRQLFLRFLGAIYCIAFLSFWVQARGLVGSHGILPVSEYLTRVHNAYGNLAYAKAPTLCWLQSADWFLTWVLCGGGVLFSLLLVIGLLPALMLVLLWAFYLSIVTVGQDFMSFQWDVLLLEAGFLAIFYAPLALRLGSPRANPPSRAVHFLIAWLLFRLMFQSGMVKLTAGDSCWHDLTALLYHYETQPLPTWTAWYVHHLPQWFQKASVALMFFVELAAPLALFAPRRLRHAACAAIIGLMALIGVTGNYNFFNLLTVALCVAMMDDALLKSFFTKRASERLVSSAPMRPRYVQRVLLGVLAALIVLYSTFDGLQATAGRKQKSLPAWLTWSPEWLGAVRNAIRPFRSINSYGLFRKMTRYRDEIVIEGSHDGRTWKEYEFKWKPGALDRAPGFVQPHQPRLDWQMWFAALERYEHQFWFQRFLGRLLESEPAVIELLASNPFPDHPPMYLRARLYRYHFTGEGEASSNWWKREFVRPYSPTLQSRR